MAPSIEAQDDSYVCARCGFPARLDADGRWIHESTADAAFCALVMTPARPSDDPPEYEPADAEAQRIAEVFADARAEQDRGL